MVAAAREKHRETGLNNIGSMAQRVCVFESVAANIIMTKDTLNMYQSSSMAP